MVIDLDRFVALSSTLTVTFEEKLRSLSSVKQSILQKAFSGELAENVVQ